MTRQVKNILQSTIHRSLNVRRRTSDKRVVEVGTEAGGYGLLVVERRDAPPEATHAPQNMPLTSTRKDPLASNVTSGGISNNFDVCFALRMPTCATEVKYTGTLAVVGSYRAQFSLVS